MEQIQRIFYKVWKNEVRVWDIIYLEGTVDIILGPNRKIQQGSDVGHGRLHDGVLGRYEQMNVKGLTETGDLRWKYGRQESKASGKGHEEMNRQKGWTYVDEKKGNSSLPYKTSSTVISIQLVVGLFDTQKIHFDLYDGSYYVGEENFHGS